MKSDWLKKALWLTPLLLFVVLGSLLYNRLGAETQIIPSQLDRQLLPDFSLENLNKPGELLSAEDLPKGPFLLNVWASWCPTCRIEHDLLMDLSAKGVPIVGVDFQDDADTARAYLSDAGDPYLSEHLSDPEGLYAVELGLTGTPETYVIGSDRRVYQHIVGAIDPIMWEQRIKPCMDWLGGGQSQQSIDEAAPKAQEICS